MQHRPMVRWLGSSLVVIVLSACSSAPGATGGPPAPTAAASTAAASVAAATTTPRAAPPVATATPSPAAAGTPLPSGWLASTTITATEQPPGSIQIEMSGPPPIFRPKALTTAAGDVTFYLVNNSPAREEHGGHALAIGTKLGEPFVVSEEIKGGGRAAFTVKGLKSGHYAIWCPLYGHMELGQTGTLTVD